MKVRAVAPPAGSGSTSARPASAPARTVTGSCRPDVEAGTTAARGREGEAGDERPEVDHFSARLHDAMLSGRVRQFRMLVTVGAVDLDAASDERGLTPLMLCAYLDRSTGGSGSVDDRLAVQMRRQLLRRGARASKADARGRTALHHDVLRRRLDLAESLLALATVDERATLLCRQDRDGATALHLAVAAGDRALVGLIAGAMARSRATVAHRAVDSRDRSGFTPLLLACRAGDLGTARLLSAAPLRASASIADPASGRDGRAWLSRFALIPSCLDPFVCPDAELAAVRLHADDKVAGGFGGARHPDDKGVGDGALSRPSLAVTSSSTLGARPQSAFAAVGGQERSAAVRQNGAPVEVTAAVAAAAAAVPASAPVSATCKQSLLALYKMLESQYGILPPARPPRQEVDDVDGEAAAAAAAAAAVAAEAERKAGVKRGTLRRRSSALVLGHAASASAAVTPKVVSDKWTIDGADDAAPSIGGAADGLKKHSSATRSHSPSGAAAAVTSEPFARGGRRRAASLAAHSSTPLHPLQRRAAASFDCDYTDESGGGGEEWSGVGGKVGTTMAAASGGGSAGGAAGAHEPKRKPSG